MDVVEMSLARLPKTSRNVREGDAGCGARVADKRTGAPVVPMREVRRANLVTESVEIQGINCSPDTPQSVRERGAGVRRWFWRLTNGSAVVTVTRAVGLGKFGNTVSRCGVQFQGERAGAMVMAVVRPGWVEEGLAIESVKREEEKSLECLLTTLKDIRACCWVRRSSER